MSAELGDHETRIANTFAEVARRLHQADSAQETWQQITDLASDIHGSFAHAAVSILHVGGKIDTPAASDDVGPAVDRIQYEENQGPCLSAIRDADIFVTGDLAAEDRWPRFSARAVDETGVRSMLSLKLFADEETLGALNIYSKTIDAFDDRAVALGNALAAHAAVAMEAAEEQMQVEHLETALVNARTIGAAVGIMMVTTNVDRERAFRILSSASQRLNVKLHILAGRIVATQETNTGPSR